MDGRVKFGRDALRPLTKLRDFTSEQLTPENPTNACQNSEWLSEFLEIKISEVRENRETKRRLTR
jgi:hypothetical protein